MGVNVTVGVENNILIEWNEHEPKLGGGKWCHIVMKNNGAIEITGQLDVFLYHQERILGKLEGIRMFNKKETGPTKETK